MPVARLVGSGEGSFATTVRGNDGAPSSASRRFMPTSPSPMRFAVNPVTSACITLVSHSVVRKSGTSSWSPPSLVGVLLVVIGRRP